MISIQSSQINQPVQSIEIQGHILLYKTEVTPFKTKPKHNDDHQFKLF